MTLNVNAIKDFGMLLHAILFDILMTQDFYHCIRLGSIHEYDGVNYSRCVPHQFGFGGT